jgi:hypothetical protein
MCFDTPLAFSVLPTDLPADAETDGLRHNKLPDIRIVF